LQVDIFAYFIHNIIITSIYRRDPTYTRDRIEIGSEFKSTIATGVRMIQLGLPQWRPQVILDSLIQKKKKRKAIIRRFWLRKSKKKEKESRPVLVEIQQ